MSHCYKISQKGAFVILLLSLLFVHSGQYGVLHAAPAIVEDAEPDGAKKQEAKASADEMFQKVTSTREEGDITGAIDLYQKIHTTFPDEAIGGKALWDLAGYKKQLALEGKGEWESARDAYREYISFYPGAKNISEAYFEIGVALNYMGYQRESLTYFKLCLKRLPSDELLGKVKLWQAKVFFAIGRFSEAEEKYQELSKHGDASIRLQAQMGKVEIFNSKKEFYSSLKIFHDLERQKPSFIFDAPEVLRFYGQTNILAGNIEKGRDQLLHYLNVAEGKVDRSEILFQVGESYWQQKKRQVAKKLFQRAIEEGQKRDRSIILSEMRIGQYLDDPLRKPAKWEMPHDLTDPIGDQPYLEVLDLFYEDPLAQDARLGLFRRFSARHDLAGMLDYGRNYLRMARLSEMSSVDKEKSGEVLLKLAEVLFAKQKYQDVYDLYYSEHEHVKNFPNGRLLYLVGQAMEAMAIYDQAAVIYYRALKWPLSKEDKIALYYRRANVYLRMGDLAASERLLTYLRKIYKGTKELGEILSYSGRLREAQKKEMEALVFYRQAAEIATFSEKKAAYASDVIRLASALDSSTALYEINLYKEKGLLAGSALQEWYAKAGDTLRGLGKFSEAILAYNAALAEDLPKDSKVVQAVQLYLGDSLFALNENEKGLEQYKMASEGDDELLKTLAVERQNQKRIEFELSRMKGK